MSGPVPYAGPWGDVEALCIHADQSGPPNYWNTVGQAFDRGGDFYANTGGEAHTWTIATNADGTGIVASNGMLVPPIFGGPPITSQPSASGWDVEWTPAVTLNAFRVTAPCTVTPGSVYYLSAVSGGYIAFPYYPFPTDTWYFEIEMTDCGFCPSGGGGGPGGGDLGTEPRAAIEIDGARGMVLVGQANRIQALESAGFALMWNSPAYAGVDTWINFKRSLRDGRLIMLSRADAGGGEFTYRIWASDDDGLTGTEVVMATGNSSLLAGTGARGALVWFVGDGSDNVTVQHSLDQGATWGKLNTDGTVTGGESNTVMYLGAPLVAKLMDKTMDPRQQGQILLICQIGGDFAGPLVSLDMGLTFA